MAGLLSGPAELRHQKRKVELFRQYDAFQRGMQPWMKGVCVLLAGGHKSPHTDGMWTFRLQESCKLALHSPNPSGSATCCGDRHRFSGSRAMLQVSPRFYTSGMLPSVIAFTDTCAVEDLPSLYPIKPLRAHLTFSVAILSAIDVVRNLGQG